MSGAYEDRQSLGSRAMPGSSRAYILELEQDKVMLQGALEAANEQVRDAYRQGYRDAQQGFPDRSQEIDLTDRALGAT
jgi:hypothetical protein